MTFAAEVLLYFDAGNTQENIPPLLNDYAFNFSLYPWKTTHTFGSSCTVDNFRDAKLHRIFSNVDKLSQVNEFSNGRKFMDATM